MMYTRGGGALDKTILEQYADLIAEREDLRKRIKATELQILKLADEIVADSVTLGKHGKKPLGRKVIRGNPSPEIEKKRAALQRYKAKLEAAEVMIGEMSEEVEEFIAKIEDSRIRRIFRYRYVDQLTWLQVALRMGKHHTAESCRNAAERYLGKRK